MTKERLRNYRALREELRRLAERLGEYEAMLYAPRVQKIRSTPSASAGNTSSVETMANTHMQLQALYRRRRDELAGELVAIESAIESLDSVERTVCQLRYIDGLKWEEVCARMNYSWRQVYNIHRRALDALREDGE